MTAHLTADALRVARHLLGLSQRDVEQRTGVARKSLVSAEATETAAMSRPSTLLRLRSFYEDQGIEFLGTIDVTTGVVRGLGARWRMPNQLPPVGTDQTPVHSHSTGLAFSAARALLDVKQSEVCRVTSISEHKLRALETGTTNDETARRRLRTFYEERGIEFLGWGDVSRGVFYGVGVRWRVVGEATRGSEPGISYEGNQNDGP
ncbi:hypothetical protein; putative Lambda repressor-like, DNA-binding [Pseudorhizobium banfieldiae]|uniref:Uncharacterized protein n=1 Tax=Pseudorhizobium banfieldiae TaxID=1125847 RepID=L0NCD1_9HYPH|nr:transcriptional regulator [arsenite-oxidising bacterium NT-25]CCF18700.1 hypothetical protein; putative Lambda repressor-like, DNA-binding [Pseudorhizobium banfieldiae]